MEFVQFEDAGAFCDATEALLLRNEAENNLMFGLARRLAKNASPVDLSAPPLLGVVQEDGAVLAAALMTPPHNLVLIAAPAPVIEYLAEALHTRGIPLPGLIAPRKATDVFVDVWCRLTERQAFLGMAMRVYQLDQVHQVPVPSGHFAEAGEEDFDLLVRWMRGFREATGQAATAVEEAVHNQLAHRQLFLWKNPKPVAMAAFARPTRNGICINAVYTPPEQRCHGYATALVAALSQRLLDAGWQFCCLFTDLSNPTPNSIYPKIGYRPVCDYAAYQFTQGG